ncbi:MmcQ/YjbR family DNA-binding protein [Couchioplanes caeruleus]|uniref:MmcQ/YjbR family DNA-binding protein n=1 Tax=Couchioplanes caeruleus TaxID=56438 RepID=UPI0020BEE809|nr:MmcQ/YjbR family DNA-binding protein [Couchioplanes caeruleus]UQU66610.1 MmcQ/YjbR family DNA-binding protein [Couchioplanes caeruleus]
MVTVQQVRTVALGLPRTTEHLIHDRVKFRVGAIVYVAFSRDETVMGFGFPKVERQALVDSEPRILHLPDASNMRFQWVQAWLSELDPARMEELVVDAWRMVVPKRVAAAYVAGLPDRQ